LDPEQSHPARAQWAKRRRQLFGFEPDPTYPLAPFHPEAIHALLARVLCHDNGRIEAGFVPVYVEPPGRPVLADTAFSQKVVDYIMRITEQAGLPSLSMTQRDDMVVLS